MIDQRADTVDLSDGDPKRTDELAHLAALRAIGVKLASWDADGGLSMVEFFELTDEERIDVAIGKLSDGDRAMYDAMTREEQAEALRKHRESVLYHSS